MPALILLLLVSIHAFGQEVITLPEPLAAPGDVPPALSDDSRYDQMLASKYSLIAHNRTFILPFSYITNPDNDLYDGALRNTKDTNYYKRAEAEFQISFFLPIYRKVAHSKWDFLMAYTHHSWWQVYNATYSKPFRETNYNPEIFFRRFGSSNGRILGADLKAIDIGYMHESNGQVEGLSRSWDRVFARAFLLQDPISIVLTGWIRIPENENDDDNPTIYRYMGVGRIDLVKNSGPFTLEMKIPIAERPGLEIRASYPWFDSWRFYVMTQAGYGHSLIEYNRDVRRIGLGITLENYFDRN